MLLARPAHTLASTNGTCLYAAACSSALMPSAKALGLGLGGLMEAADQGRV